MKKRHTINIGGFISSMIAVYLIYYVLLQDDLLPFSIRSVLSAMNHWAHSWHVLAVGLMPIYLAIVIFGAAMTGIYLGSALHRWIQRFIQHR